MKFSIYFILKSGRIICKKDFYRLSDVINYAITTGEKISDSNVSLVYGPVLVAVEVFEESEDEEVEDRFLIKYKDTLNIFLLRPYSLKNQIWYYINGWIKNLEFARS